MVIATTALAFVLTYMFGYEDEVSEEDRTEELLEEADPLTDSVNENVSDEIVWSPLSGEIVPLTSVNDPVFASETMGKGLAVKPDSNTIYSPVNGTVQIAFETGHAYGLKSDKGAEILMHIGIDTVSMDGKGFTKTVKANQKVKQGDILGTFDSKEIAKANLDDTTMIIMTNTASYSEIIPVVEGHINVGDKLIEVK